MSAPLAGHRRCIRVVWGLDVEFTISELTQQFATFWALDAIRTRLMNAGSDVRRYVPHMLEHIVRGAAESTVAREAFDSLAAMLSDSAPVVRGEACASLARIARSESELTGLAKDVLPGS